MWDAYGIISDIELSTNGFPQADIHHLFALDLLHQIIKGTFKDHLVTWIGEYLVIKHSKAGANAIWDEIDRRIAAVLPFPGLHQFPDGRRFKQWTSNDSKALMKHSLKHYQHLIEEFGAPNGLCLLFNHRMKHIKSVKEPWRRSNKFNALGQMLLSNQRIDKLRAFLEASNLLKGSILDTTYAFLLVFASEECEDDNEGLDESKLLENECDGEGEEDDDDEEGPVPRVDILGKVVLAWTLEHGSIKDVNSLAEKLNRPHFDLFKSAIATFCTPSDASSVGGMKREWIFINEELHGMRALAVLCVKAFFSFSYNGADEISAGELETQHPKQHTQPKSQAARSEASRE
ncbi:hypothetical protein EST38_g14540 [Candolleomyces aberdarensis]|uniref:Uncharacterized protein n=1 Tax=Candolleomyces aberdarensis TaxID=2316362 RepID=A0A4Q2CZN8_9AGAR|nr:hypothetical protein EST38_g14540 [Candolleomyces aberdarensis]